MSITNHTHKNKQIHDVTFTISDVNRAKKHHQQTFIRFINSNPFSRAVHSALHIFSP